MYTVLWRPTAVNRLADIWVAASDRNRINAAVEQIDAQLRVDPEAQSESRAEGRRILIEPPLGVIFRVIDEDRHVSS